MATLSILGAAYGLGDVTQTVRDQVQNDSLRVGANNTTFGDTWANQPKSLVIVYQYDPQPPQVLVVAEGGTASITDGQLTANWSPPAFDQFTVLGAAYGLDDVTQTLQGLVSDNELNVAAENATFGESWPNVIKTLVVVSQYRGLTLTRIVQEHTQLATLPLTILGATWGPEDVTDQVAAHVDAFQELHLTAGNVVFDDPWFGHHKSLVVVYQYGDEQPQTAIAQEDSWVSLGYSPKPAFQPSSNTAALQVLGAAYGLEDVTTTVSAMATGDRLIAQVNDTSLGQQGGWPEPDLKTLTVVYQYGSGPAEVVCVQQNASLQILPSGNYALQLSDGASVNCSPPSFGTGDFTLEAWVQTTQRGPIFTMQRAAIGPPPYENLALGIDTNGCLLFGAAMFDQASGAMQAAADFRAAQPSPLLDGEWHHVAIVRSGITIVAYIDGEAIQNTSSTSNNVVALAAATSFRLGTANPSPVALVADIGQSFTGLLDEVRLWTVALSQAVIEDGMHHQLTDQETGLVAHWTFDQQSLGDSSPAGRTLTPLGSVLYAVSDIDIEPEGSPYLVTQAQLMQDYIPDPDHPGQFKPIDGYRVHIVARDGSGNPIPTGITIWAADPDYPAQVHFLDASNAAVTDQTSTSRVTNAHGEISFVIDSAAVGNPLVCPPIKIRASFMAPQERVVISPDRHVHATLAGITGDQLAGRSSLPSGKTAALAGASNQSSQQLAVSATAINQVMSAAVDHTIQPERPLVRKRSAPIDLPVPEPYAAGYENIYTFVTPYDFPSNAQSTHFLPADQSITRILAPENMDAPHWHFDWSNAQVASISLEQRQQIVGGLNVTHLDAFTQQFSNQAAVTLTSQQLLTIAQSQDSPTARQKRWFGSSFLSQVVSATQIILTTVSSTLEDVEETVETLVVTVVNAAGQAFDAALQTVEDAIDFAIAVFQKIGATVVDVVDFVKALFDWDDILLTQQAIGAVLLQVPTWIKASLTSAQTQVDNWLTNLKASVEANFDQWINGMTGQTFNQQTTPAKNSPPPNLQAKYVTSMYADNLSSSNDDDNPFVSGAQPDQQMGDTWRTTFPPASTTTLQSNLQSEDIWSFFTNPEALLGGLLKEFLTLVKEAIISGIDLIKNGIVDTFFSALQTAIDQVSTLCTTRIVIPYITDFYEQVVLRNSASRFGVLGHFNMLSLISLAGAIPTTVAYKLATGEDNPPFNADDVSQLQNPQWSAYASATEWLDPLLGGSAATNENVKRSAAVAGDATIGAWEKATWAIGYTYAVATWVWGAACVIEDTPGSSLNPWKKTVAGVKCTAQFVTICTGLPVFWETIDDGQRQPYPTNTLIPTAVIYFGGIVAFGSNFVCFCDLFSAAQTAPGVVWFRDFFDPLLTGVYGLVQVVCYGCILFFTLGEDSPLEKGLNIYLSLGEAFEWVPQLGKLPNPLQEFTKPAVPVVELAAYALAGLAATGITSLHLARRVLA